MFSKKKKQEEYAGSEARRAHRKKVTLRARIILNPDCIYDCKVLDTSPGGAMIGLCQKAYIPKTFSLEVIDENITLKCRRAWQRGARLGVQFIREKSRNPVNIPARLIVDRNRIYKCTVKNITREGAMIKLAKETPIPLSFKLNIIDNKNTVKKGRRVWQIGTRLGVQFIRD